MKNRISALVVAIVVFFATVSQLAAGTGRRRVVQPGNPSARLRGQYAFLLSGFNGDGFMMIAGTFIADGNGKITDGTEDISTVLGLMNGVPFTGTYSVGPDNRGSATFVPPPYG